MRRVGFVGFFVVLAWARTGLAAAAAVDGELLVKFRSTFPKRKLGRVCRRNVKRRTGAGGQRMRGEEGKEGGMGEGETGCDREDVEEEEEREERRSWP
jgi:hypothetical protein